MERQQDGSLENDNDEFIVEPGAVETPEATEPEEAPANPEGESEEVVPEETETPAEESTEPAVDPDTQAAIEEGRKILAYKQAHPGWDPFLMERDYREKTARLAKLEKQVLPQEAVPRPPAEPIEDLSDVHPDDVKRVEKILRARGYVRKDEIEAERREREKQGYEQVKKEQLNAFLSDHPEYRPENDPGDKRWQMLLDEYSLYQAPSDPVKIKLLLSRAHEQVRRAFVEPKDAAPVLAQKRVNKAAKVSGGGATAAAPKKGSSLKGYAHFLKGFSEDEIAEIVNS